MPRGPEGFEYSKGDEFAAQHGVIDQLLGEVGFAHHNPNDKFKETLAGRAILAEAPDASRRTVLALLARVAWLDGKVEAIRERSPVNPHMEPGWGEIWPWRRALHEVMATLLRRKLPFTRDDVHTLLMWCLTHKRDLHPYFVTVSGGVLAAEHLAAGQGLGDRERTALTEFHEMLVAGPKTPEMRKLAERVERLLGTAPAIRIVAGEAWADQALADLEALSPESHAAWAALIAHSRTASGGASTAKWSKVTAALVAKLGTEDLATKLLTWFALIDRPRTVPIESWSQWGPNPNLMINSVNLEILKGLVWCCPRSNRDLARALSAVALSAYRKVPGIGPRAPKLGNACIYMLGELDGRLGVDQLAVLKVRVKFRPAQKGIEKALTATAARLGIPADELEEMAVPAYGLTEVGYREEQFGEFTAELRVNSSTSTEISWSKRDGDGTVKRLKSVPAAVKRDFKEDLKELNDAVKDIERMLPTQRERIDGLYLRQKTWPYAAWKERYLDHPLVGVLARRLIWITTGDVAQAAAFCDGQLLDASDRPLLSPSAETQVSLWHPITASTPEIHAWRAWLENHQVTQPFKQAHREIYLLTDAERQTRVYSNRFAAHIIRQHQFNALCGVRGWRNVLRLMVDSVFPPASLEIPVHGLRAEFWADGAGSEYGVDTNDTGTYHRLATDQVRFYRTGAVATDGDGFGGGHRNPAEPVPLDQVPPLVLSEVLRDVDLFVGVASVGNDPTWNDGGPDGRHRDYWHDYSFGDLSATAQTRKQILERLVPRLKIADRCSLTEKFLVVRGDIHTYKIHLGSANIIMSPNDQYLCIVQGRGRALDAPGDVFLPFEGDNVLSLILSKAFMLAADTKITDPTILSQLRR